MKIAQCDLHYILFQKNYYICPRKERGAAVVAEIIPNEPRTGNAV